MYNCTILIYYSFKFIQIFDVPSQKAHPPPLITLRTIYNCCFATNATWNYQINCLLLKKKILNIFKKQKKTWIEINTALFGSFYNVFVIDCVSSSFLYLIFLINFFYFCSIDFTAAFASKSLKKIQNVLCAF